MIPTYPYSQQSSSFSPPMPIDLNIEDQSHDLIFSPTYQPSSSSNSTLSSPYPILFNPSHHDHAGSSSYYCQPNHFQTHEHLQGEKIVGARGSWDDPAADNKEGERKRGLKLQVWKKGSDDEDNKKEGHQNQKNNNHETHEDNYIIDDSVKWMPSKMRIMRKMMANSVSDQKGHKFEDQTQSQKQQPLILMSPLGTDNSSSNSSSSNNITVVRVCADCHTTKTPLWRSGPRGPKSLCNACGIRQRKARRAMAAAAMAANGSASIAMETSRGYKIERKEKKSKMECERERDLKKNKKKKKKKKRKLVGEGKAIGRGRKKFRFDLEDLAVRLSKKLGPLSQVFPQDEKEAAILLMALSYNYNGLLHG